MKGARLGTARLVRYGTDSLANRLTLARRDPARLQTESESRSTDWLLQRLPIFRLIRFRALRVLLQLLF